jgi:hypothetical protein
MRLVKKAADLDLTGTEKVFYRQWCGFGMFFPIPDQTFFHPGSEFFPFFPFFHTGLGSGI